MELNNYCFKLVFETHNDGMAARGTLQTICENYTASDSALINYIKLGVFKQLLNEAVLNLERELSVYNVKCVKESVEMVPAMVFNVLVNGEREKVCFAGPFFNIVLGINDEEFDKIIDAFDRVKKLKSGENIINQNDEESARSHMMRKKRNAKLESIVKDVFNSCIMSKLLIKVKESNSGKEVEIKKNIAPVFRVIANIKKI